MAVSRDYDKINIILDAYATQFAIDFDVNTDDYGNAINIKVYLGLDELTKDVDYTITNKTVNYPDAVNHVGEKLTIYRETPIEQPVDFVDNGNFTLEDIEAMGDRAIMILQEQSSDLDDTISAQESAERAEQYKDIAIEKASDAEDWAVGTRSDGESPQHSSESSKHYAQAAATSEGQATSMRNQALSYRLVSEGYATGQQTGVDVDSSSPYYHNNSKYYKEQAGTSATSASASESKAKDWATKGEDLPVEPGLYSAKHWAHKASTSAGGASVSAYNAGLSEQKAEDWAEKAEDVEVETGKYSAKHWASKSATSASNASTSETNAGLSETAAAGSAEDSEAWAVGKRGGTDVPPTDPAYHNNAKYYADQTAANSVTPDNVVTLTNKTIDAKDNTLICTATSITSSQTLTPTKQMMVTIDAGVTLTLGSGSYIGQELPVLAQTTCDVSYTGEDGASVDNLNAGDYITYVWQGTYWIVDASTYIKPTYISTSQTVTPTKAMLLVIDTDSVVLTLGNGMYDGFELPVLAQADCSIVYTGVNGTVTETREDGDYNVFVWNDSYWVPKQTTPVTGIDDNGQPFAFNIDSMVHHQGLINLTGTDANGNPFDYGLGRLVTNADEDNLVLNTEIKTSKTYKGKPVYVQIFEFTIPSFTTPLNATNYLMGTISNKRETVSVSAIMNVGGQEIKMPYMGFGNWSGSGFPITAGSRIDINSLGQVYLLLLSNWNGIIGSIVTTTVYYTKTTD